eukprot:scaffold262174_cov26-Tisochrysis_lutea.AAC.2
MKATSPTSSSSSSIVSWTVSTTASEGSLSRSADGGGTSICTLRSMPSGGFHPGARGVPPPYLGVPPLPAFSSPSSSSLTPL